MPADTTLDRTALDIARRLLPDRDIATRQVHGGGNNRVYRLTSIGAPDHALKLYAPPGTDRQDALGRLQREYGGLAFLAPHLPGRVPAAVKVDWDNLAAIYEWVDGNRPSLTAARPSQDIAAVISFIADLRRLSPVARKTDTGFDKTAREACLSAQELLRQVRNRMDTLCAVSQERDLQQLLAEEVQPIFELAAGQLETWCTAYAIALGDEISADRQILSPSDFGFHNALRRPGGELIFIDFEYFGWDDPVKLLADFIWHPAMRLSDRERERFIEESLAALLPGDPLLQGRLWAQFPLYGLRWAAILLNEFLPERWQRRVFAGAADPSPTAWQAAKQRQLASARRYLQIARAASKTSSLEPASAFLSIMNLNQ